MNTEEVSAASQKRRSSSGFNFREHTLQGYSSEQKMGIVMVERTSVNDRIDEWIDSHTEEMLEDLKTLVRIPSIKGKEQEGMPYGSACAKAVAAMQDLMEKYDLRTTNYENHCIAGDLDAPGEKALDILAHLDVVPVSEDWTKTKPFEPLIEGDCIYGRGTQDDKGPAVAALYAMRCIKELGIGLKRGVRLLCGSDEECGSKDLEYYYSKEQEAEFTFSPDADYPLINIEKGRLAKSFHAGGKLTHPVYAVEEGSVRQFADNRFKDPVHTPGTGQIGGSAVSGQGVRVLDIEAGKIVNVIPGKGCLRLLGASDEVLSAAAKKVKEKAGGSFAWETIGGETTVRVTGETGHAAFPENAVNCVTLILEFLRCLPLQDDSGERMLLAMGRLWPHGEYNGASLGVNYSDTKSGALTMSLDVLRYESGRDGTEYLLSGLFDCRAPICCNDENLTEKVRERLRAAGLEMEEGGMTPSHYVSPDSEIVTKLLESYELYFGRKGEPLVTGGGTYVHHLERGVAFGCEVEGVDNRIHGDDEFAQIPVLTKSARIFADAIIRLCG